MDKLKNGELRMTISPEMETMFKKEPFFLEIEMLQGSKRVLKSGMIKYKLTVADHDKQQMIKEFILKTISHSHKSCKN